MWCHVLEADGQCAVSEQWPDDHVTDQSSIDIKTPIVRCHVQTCYHTAARRVKSGFHPNAIACVGKQPIMVATASTEHPIGCCLQPIGCSVEAVANMIGCFPTHALTFSPVSIQTQRTQRKRLRLGKNRALHCAGWRSSTTQMAVSLV